MRYSKNPKLQDKLNAMKKNDNLTHYIGGGQPNQSDLINEAHFDSEVGIACFILSIVLHFGQNLLDESSYL
jgi:hypothetical protein